MSLFWRVIIPLILLVGIIATAAWLGITELETYAHFVQHSFSEFQSKDWATVIISSAAFVISLLGYFQKSAEATRSMRTQLTTTLAQLHQLNIENAKANDPKLASDFPENYGRLITDQ